MLLALVSWKMRVLFAPSVMVVVPLSCVRQATTQPGPAVTMLPVFIELAPTVPASAPLEPSRRVAAVVLQVEPLVGEISAIEIEQTSDAAGVSLTVFAPEA